MKISIIISEQSISLEEALRAVGCPADGGASHYPEGGALVTFCGNVRRMEDGRAIEKLYYEHYPGMAEGEAGKLINAAEERWPLLAAAVHHRTGAVLVGEPAVIVAVLASHRNEAFEAARYLIDELKKSVPLWKVIAE